MPSSTTAHSLSLRLRFSSRGATPELTQLEIGVGNGPRQVIPMSPPQRIDDALTSKFCAAVTRLALMVREDIAALPFATVMIETDEVLLRNLHVSSRLDDAGVTHLVLRFGEVWGDLSSLFAHKPGIAAEIYA